MELYFYGELTQKYGELTRVPQEGGRVQVWESAFSGGTIMFLGNLKDDRPKIPRFYHPSSIIQKDSIFRQRYFCFNKIYLCFMDLGISKIDQASTIVFSFYFKR